MIDFQEYLRDFKNKDQKIDFIVITGDYRNIRSNENFDKAKDFIYKLMNLFQLDLSQDLYIVPGNHDMCIQKRKTIESGYLCRKKTTDIDDDPRTHELKKLLPTGLEPWDRTKYSDDWMKRHATDPESYIDRLCGEQRYTAQDEYIVNLRPLTDGFTDYCTMAKSIVPWYEGNGVSPATTHNRKRENDSRTGLNLVHLNTALVADGSHNHYQAIDLISVKKILNDIRNGLPTLILAHNSFYDLHPEIRKQLIVPLSHANTYAWLCGDAHRFSTEKKIARPTDDGREPIQILTCGKSAPDHNDTYSDNGFFEYEYDGTNISAQYYKWSAIQTQKGAKIQISTQSPSTIGIKDGASTPKHLMIGYLSCNPTVKFENKYHLGHAYFIHKIDELLNEKNYALIMTSSSLRANNRTKKTYEEDVKYGNQMIAMWKNCFHGKVEIIDIKTHFEETIAPLDKMALELLNFVNTMERVMEKDRKCNHIVDNWFQNKIIEESDLNYIKDKFNESHGAATNQTELLSFAYLLHKRPMWYTSDWLIRFIDFWNKQIYFLIQNELHIPVHSNDFYIIESKRNHYVWDAVSFCAKRYAYNNFPKVTYYDNLMDTDLTLPMRSSDMDKAVFMANYNNGAKYSDKFISHVKKMFGTEKEPEALAKEYYSRLFNS